MTLTEYLANMRTELSDSGSTWTDAELTRGVRKSVSLMSRVAPNRDVVEATIGADVDDESITMPATADPDAIVDGVSIASTSSGDTLTITDHTPDVPRRLTVTLTDASGHITAISVIVKGYDKDSKYIEETWGIADLVSGTAKQGNLYFKRVTEVEVDNIAGNSSGETLDVGTGNAYDSFVYLANRAIKYDSETVVNASSAEMTRDTDYIMDYINGGIKLISGGSITAGTACTIDYSLDTRVLDIAPLLPTGSYLKVERCEFPVGDDPATFVVPEILGEFAYIKGHDTSLGEDDHIRLIYTKPWRAPGTNSEGDYPEHLDDVVIIGSCGQALLIKAEKYVQQAITEIGLANTSADNMATPLADINTALDKVATYLETNDTTDNAKDVLANITDDIANLRTAIATALDAANAELDAGDFSDVATHLTAAGTALGKVATYLEDNSNEDSKYWLTKITTDIAGLRTAVLTAVDAANTHLDEVDTTDLTGSGDDSAEAALKKGEDYIVTINDAEDVGGKYAEYSKAWQGICATRTNVAIGFLREATTRLDNLRSYIEQAAGWGEIATGFVAEAAQRVNMALQVVNRESAIATQAAGYIEEARMRLDNIRTYIEEANGWIRMGDTFIGEATQRVNEVNAHATQADRYIATGTQYLNIAGRYLASGQAKINEMLTALGVKAESIMSQGAIAQF